MSRKIALAVCVLAAWAAFAAAQTFPRPATTPNTPVACASCVTDYRGTQTIGYPSPPYKRFVGRYVDSAITGDWQAPWRTTRAGFIRVSPDNNRLYMRIGAAVTAYNLDTFFTRITTPPVPISSKFFVYASPPELYQPFDEYLYPEMENGSGWSVRDNNPDGQDRLFDMDTDDRGMIYSAYGPFGWGIARDDKSTGGGQFPFVSQHKVGADSVSIAPHSIISLKGGGSSYYALVSDEQSGTTAVFDVTNPQTPLFLRTANVGLGSGQDAHFAARSATRSTVAVISGNSMGIYPLTYFATGAATPARFEGIFKTVVFDGTTLWATEMVNGALVLDQFTPNGFGAYSKTGSFSTGLPFIPSSANFNSGYLTLATQSGTFDVRVFKIVNGQPQLVDLGSYIPGYYSSPPHDYARATHLTLFDAAVVSQGTHTYLILGFGSLGDVYELVGADAVTASVVRLGDTTNPNVPAGSPAGPFPGDIITFNGARTNGASAALLWNFGNAEAPSATDQLRQNIVTAATGNVKHQYAGLTPSSVATPRTVNVSDSSDSSVTGSVDITLAAPTARVLVQQTGALFTANSTSSAVPLVVGDTLADASDGSVESHYSSWTLTGASSASGSSSPLVTLPAAGVTPQCGSQTLNFSAHYGPYTANYTTLNGTDYPVSINNITYTVKPFTLGAVTYAPTAGNRITFNASARVPATPTQILNSGFPSTWTVTWALSNSNVPPQVSTVAIGTIPSFVVDLSAIPTGSVASVTVALASGAAISSCANSASQSASVTATVPNPVLRADSCSATNLPCSVTDITAGDDTSWTYAWTLTLAGVPIGTASSGKTFTFPTVSTPGSYVVNLRVTNVFGSKDAVALTVPLTAPVCGPGPSSINIVPTYSGPDGCKQRGTNCTPGEQLTFNISAILYVLSPTCDRIDWDFGDGSAHSTQTSPTHTYPTSTNTYQAVLTLTSGTNAPLVLPVAVNFGTNTPDPPPSNPPPSNPGGCGSFDTNNVFSTFLGNVSGCTPSSVRLGNGLCQAGETITFAFRTFNYDLSCTAHSYSWTFSDGGFVAGSSTTHTFGAPGTYTVSTTVSNGVTSLPQTLTVVIAGSQNNACAVAPTAANIAAVYSGTQSGCSSGNSTPCTTNDTVAFDLSPTNYTFGSCDTIAWTFGDGGTSSAKNPTHTFSVATGTSQTFTVQATITNTHGTVTLTKNVTVNKVVGQCNVAPTTFNLVPKFLGATSKCSNKNTTQCSPGETITYDLDAVLYNFQSCDNVLWDFGDGQTLAGRTVNHIYTGATQNYKTYATVTNDSGNVRLGPLSVNFGAPAQPANVQFTVVTPQPVIPGAPIKFQVQTPYSPAVKWEWSWGDGNGASRTLPDVTNSDGYEDAGTYVVTVVARDASGASIGTASRSVTVVRPRRRGAHS